MTRGWILYKNEKYKLNKHYVDLYYRAVVDSDMKLQLIIYEDFEFGIVDGRQVFYYNGQEVEKPRFVINRTGEHWIAEIFESMGIIVVNNSTVTRVANDKRIAHALISRANIKEMDTVLKTTNRMIAESYLSFPYVIKDPFGSGGSSVELVNSYKERDVFCNKQLYIAQKFAKDSRDVRVYVIGNEIIVAIMREGIGTFKSNYSLGGYCEIYNLTKKQINTVNKVIGMFRFDFVGIDFFIDGDDFIFNEIEDVVGSRMVYKLTDIDIVSKYIKHIERKIKMVDYDEKKY